MPRKEPSGVHTVMWEGTTNCGLVLAELRFGNPSNELSGMVATIDAGKPLRVEYRIVCDSAWRTRSIQFDVSRGDTKSRLLLRHDGCGKWFRNGREDLSLQGCAAVDLEVASLTDGLVTRRFELAVHAEGEIRVAWVRIPPLLVEPAMQTYSRLARNEYEYRHRSGSFYARLEVDDEALPTVHGNLWRRVCK